MHNKWPHYYTIDSWKISNYSFLKKFNCIYDDKNNLVIHLQAIDIILSFRYVEKIVIWIEYVNFKAWYNNGSWLLELIFSFCWDTGVSELRDVKFIRIRKE